MTAQEWFEEFPLFVPDRVACGHGLKAGKPKVILAFELHGEGHVFAFSPDEADGIAKQLRRGAGAVRALETQEAASR